MHMGKTMRVIAIAICFVFATSGVSMAASFGEFASGVKTLTESAKDVNEISKDQKQTPQPTKSSTKKNSRKKASTPRDDERVRGG